jgi:cupin fold WbuC family metalloprotein
VLLRNAGYSVWPTDPVQCPWCYTFPRLILLQEPDLGNAMKILDKKTIESLSEQAAASPRLRKNLNLHGELDDPVQRLCNAMEPGTYVRPHRHSAKWELFLVVSGSLAVLTFDDMGKVLTRTRLSSTGPDFGIEIPENTWHTLVSLAPGTVMFEVKQGPYAPPAREDFAAWAPEESSAKAAAFVEWFNNAEVGSGHP